MVLLSASAGLHGLNVVALLCRLYTRSGISRVRPAASVSPALIRAAFGLARSIPPCAIHGRTRLFSRFKTMK